MDQYRYTKYIPTSFMKKSIALTECPITRRIKSETRSRARRSIEKSSSLLSGSASTALSYVKNSSLAAATTTNYHYTRQMPPQTTVQMRQKRPVAWGARPTKLQYR